MLTRPPMTTALRLEVVGSLTARWVHKFIKLANSCYKESQWKCPTQGCTTAVHRPCAPSLLLRHHRQLILHSASSSSSLANALENGSIEAGPIETGPIEIGPIEAGPIEAGPDEAGLPVRCLTFSFTTKC